MYERSIWALGGGFGQVSLESNVIPIIIGIITFLCLFLTWLTLDFTSGPIQAITDYSGWDLLDTDQAQKSYPVVASIFGLISTILALVGIVSRKNVTIGLIITQFITFLVSLLFIILAPSYSHYQVVVEIEQSTSVSFAPYVVMIASLVSFLYTLIPVVMFYLYPRFADSDSKLLSAMLAHKNKRLALRIFRFVKYNIIITFRTSHSFHKPTE